MQNFVTHKESHKIELSADVSIFLLRKVVFEKMGVECKASETYKIDWFFGVLFFTLLWKNECQEKNIGHTAKQLIVSKSRGV